MKEITEKLKNSFSSLSAFTLVELVVVVVVLGILAGVGIPRYLDARKNYYYEQAQAGLRGIHTANSILYDRTRAYWPPTSATRNANAINNNLELSLFEDKVIYSCTGTNGSAYTCRADIQFPGESGKWWFVGPGPLVAGINPGYNNSSQPPTCSSGACIGGSGPGLPCIQDSDCTP